MADQKILDGGIFWAKLLAQHLERAGARAQARVQARAQKHTRYGDATFARARCYDCGNAVHELVCVHVRVQMPRRPRAKPKGPRLSSCPRCVSRSWVVLVSVGHGRCSCQSVMVGARVNIEVQVRFVARGET